MSKKKSILIVILLTLLIAIGFTLYFVQKLPPSVYASNGEKIIINEISYASVYSDEKFETLSEESYTLGEDLNIDVNLPSDMCNMVHLYQVQDDSNGNPVLHDEVYLWETEKYTDHGENETIVVYRTTGEEELCNDRGYFELILCKETPPLRTWETLFAEELHFAYSKLNGKGVIVKKLLDASEGDIGTYEATIKQVAGEGTYAYLTANNVSMEEFIEVLECVVGI